MHVSLQIHQEYTFRHRSACRMPAESRQKYLTRGKEYIEPCKTHYDERTRGGTGVLVGLDLPWAGGGTEAGVRSPQRGNCLSQRRRLRVKRLICDSLNGIRIRQSLHSHTYPGQRRRSPRRHRGWELEFRDCGENLG